MTEWIAPIMGLIGVLVGMGIVEIRLRREQKERYQVMTFEKRLEAHQQAFAWCTKISNLLGQTYGDASSVEVNEHTTALNILYNEATEWWWNNCLYLDKNSRISVFDAIGLPLDRAEQLTEGVNPTDEFIQQSRDTIKKAIRHITKGIGVKYLPDIDRESKKRTTPPK